MTRTEAGGFVSKFSAKFYLFGGISDSSIFNDLWEFDLETQEWTELLAPNPPMPLHRFGYTSFEDEYSNECFLVFGGTSVHSLQNTLLM